jgi:hypothetical protein
MFALFVEMSAVLVAIFALLVLIPSAFVAILALFD